MSNEYKTIAEIAKLANKPKATIYQLIRKPPYNKCVIVENGIKKVSIDLLLMLNGTAAEKPIEDNTDSNTPQGEPQKGKETESDSNSDKLSDVESLRKEIARLNLIIEDKDKQLIEWGNKFAELASQAQVIASQAQILHASKELPAADGDPQAPKESLFRRLFKRKA